jgi:WD40 repeat protein
MSLPRGAVKLEGHTGGVNRIVLLPGGELIATASSDETVCVFSAATGALLRTLAGHEKMVNGLAALGGDVIASGDVGHVMRVWNARTGGCSYVGELGGFVDGIATLGAGRFVAGAGRDLAVFEHRDGGDVTEVRRIREAHEGDVWDIAVCGARIATLAFDTTAAVWDAATLGRLAVLEGHTNVVCSLSMDWRHVVTTTMDQTLRVYDAQTFSCVRVVSNLHAGLVHWTVLLGTDHMLSFCDKAAVVVSNVASGELYARVELPFSVYCTAITRDGRLAVGGKDGNIALLHPPPAAALPILCHNLAANPGRALRAFLAMQTGADPSILRRTLAGRRK